MPTKELGKKVRVMTMRVILARLNMVLILNLRLDITDNI